MIKNNIPPNETRAMTMTLLVDGGVDTAISNKAIPGFLINNLENVMEAITDYIEEKNRSEEVNKND